VVLSQHVGCFSELGNDRSIPVEPKRSYHYHNDCYMLVAIVTNCDENLHCAWDL
jgi:hypothetical protein